MSNTASSTSSSGLGLVSVLTIVFVILKLTENIDWSWIWVLSPLWMSALLVAGTAFFVIVIGLIAAAVKR